MRVLVTGSGGFIGGSIGRAAARAGHQVLGLARRSQPERDWPGAHQQVDVAHADLSGVIRDFKPDIVFHGAGTASVGASLAAPLEDLRAAILTWANVLEGVRRSGVSATVFFPSSAAVYGNPLELPVSEDDAVAPISPYGYHKAACELLAAEYASCFGLNIIVGRLFSVFGARQRRLLVWELFSQLIGVEPIVTLQGTGTESRDFLYVEDLAEAILMLADSASSGSGGRLQIVNFGSGTETRVCDLAGQLARIVNSKKEIRYRGTPRPGDPTHWRANNARVKSMIPTWQPRSLAAALSHCVEAWRVESQR